jgi:hypothetical protein
MLLFALFGSCLFRSYTDALNLHTRQFAAMANRAVITFAPLVFECDDFLVLALFQNFRSHLRPRDERAPVRDVLSVGKHQHLAEGCCLARLDIEKIDIDRVAFRNAKLPATSLDNCGSHELREKAAQTSTDEPA